MADLVDINFLPWAKIIKHYQGQFLDQVERYSGISFKSAWEFSCGPKTILEDEL